jgi:hypothetical protein
MPESNTAGEVTVTIPVTGDAADINKAFKDYHANVGAAITLKANIAGATFTGNVTAPNLTANTKVTTTTVTTTAYLDANTIANANAHTVTVDGLAYSAVRGARYFPDSNATPYDTNTANVKQVRVIVSQYSPNTNTLVAGDVWISWAV